MANNHNTLGARLHSHGISRRGCLKFCAATTSMMALPPNMIPVVAAVLENARRPSVIRLSFQKCTGCSESLTRAHSPTVEGLSSMPFPSIITTRSGQPPDRRQKRPGCKPSTTTGGSIL
jgi:Ni,Fe-hydrogenase I small subunit